MKKAAENFRQKVNEVLRRTLPTLWNKLLQEDEQELNPQFPININGDDQASKLVRGAILAGVYEAMSARALSAEGQLDTETADLMKLVTPDGELLSGTSSFCPA